MTEEVIICDANVLIDYLQADRTMLTLLATSVGTINVPDVIIHEVDGFTIEAAVELGFRVIEAPVELPEEPSLSYEDRVVLHFVRENQWTCLANDRALRRACEKAGGKVIWGLEMILRLVEAGKLDSTKAREIAQKISDHNVEITPRIIAEFSSKLTNFE